MATHATIHFIYEMWYGSKFIHTRYIFIKIENKFKNDSKLTQSTKKT